MRVRRRRRGAPEQLAVEDVKSALERLDQDGAWGAPEGLIGLVAALRPRRSKNVDEARHRLDALIGILESDQRCRSNLRRAVRTILADKQWLHLFADAGVLSGEGFFTGLGRRVAHAILPDVYEEGSLRDYLGRLFPRSTDHEWVAALPDESWIRLMHVLELGEVEEGARARVANQLLEALQVLSYRIAAMGLEPELVRNHPAIERYESPFLAQSEEVRQYIRDQRLAEQEGRTTPVDDKHLLVLLDQCLEIVARIRKQAASSGASVSLTGLTVRLQESMGRMRALLALSEPRTSHEADAQRVRMFKELVRAQGQDRDLRAHWARHMELLALRVTGNAGKTGEHYITSTRAEYRKMFRSAAGAGIVIAFLALIKVALMSTTSAPFVEAALYSLNYGLGFVLIYVLHCTIATKQPAMTAAHIAAALGSGGRADRMDGLADLIVRTVRSQFIAVVGNLAIVVPLAVLLALGFRAWTGVHLATPAQSEYLLHDLSPVESPALFHAAIAGVCLFLSGLISGYYDNRAVYSELRLRISQRPMLRRILGADRTEEVGRYIEDHLGGISGNFLFGVMLGSMGTIGFVLGAPLDIRHITFSSAYVGIAAVGLDWRVPTDILLISVVGVAAIGVINLVVSFALALWIAMRSRRVTFLETPDLMRRLGSRLRTQPGSFLVPPREQVPPRDPEPV
ncbi:MAG: site-specific recombinase [Longimicrobiales bacterium]